MTSTGQQAKQVQGFTASGFKPLRQAFQQNFDAGLDVGASLCVIQRGKVVADLWGGSLDLESRDAWQADTLINIYSTTKGIAALAFATLVEDGILDYEQPVADIWPELLAGSDGLSVGDLLAHKGGICGVDTRLRVEDLYDWPKMIHLLSQQQPFWPPGHGAGYHAVVWGYLPGELARRATGKTLGQIVRERLATPLQADFYLCLDAAEDYRVAPLIGPNRSRLPPPGVVTEVAPQPLFAVALQNPGIRPYQDAYSIPWRRAELAASNGHASARGIARIYAAHARVTDGLLSQRTLSSLLQPRTENVFDQVLGQQIRRGAGVILNHDGMFGAGTQSFGHPGAGGSMGFADPEHEIGFGYVMNQMLSGEYASTRINRLYEALASCVEQTT